MAILSNLKSCQFAPKIVIFNLFICCQFEDSQIISPKIIPMSRLNIFLKKMNPRWIILGKIICESSNWQHIQRLKITILGANWQLFRLERIAKCSYFILSTQNIKFHWIVMKIKIFLLPIGWYNRDLFQIYIRYQICGLHSKWEWRPHYINS